MNITKNKQNQITTVSLEGRIDTLSAPELEGYLLPLLRKDNPVIVVDLAKVDYISSAGLRTFLIARKLVETVEGKLILQNMNQRVKQVFDITGFTPMFEVR
ncbi:MAG: STAS domain-containing protein [Alphaproteobacteria bacterium]|nr:STAS domain-containing protein [Alphaproteobacteria bacterium]